MIHPQFERSLYELNRLFQYAFPGLPRTDKQVAVVSISAETQPSALQVFVELVEDDQRQNRAKVRALRRTFLSGRDKTVLHDAIA